MMAIKVPEHTRKLADLVNRPGGVTASEAVAAAEAKLESLRERGLGEITAAVAQCHALGEQLAAAPTAAAQAELYRLGNFLVGVSGVFGLGGVGEVAFSLCTLLDRLRTSGIWSMRPVQIHLDSLRLVHAGDMPAAEKAAIVAALRKVVEKVAAPAA